MEPLTRARRRRHRQPERGAERHGARWRRVAFHDNDIVLSGTAAKAALFRRLHDASIARNVVSGTSVDGIVTRGCQGASIVNNDLAGFTATGGFKILLDDASDSTVSGNDGVEAADVFDDGSGNVVDE